MKKPGEVVIKETKYIALVVIILSLVMNVVFVLLKKWDYTVLTGNLLSATFAIANFLFMGMTVEKAVLQDEKDAKKTIKTSQSIRQLMILAVVAFGAIVKFFNIWATVIPFLFPRIAIGLRTISGKNK